MSKEKNGQSKTVGKHGIKSNKVDEIVEKKQKTKLTIDDLLAKNKCLADCCEKSRTKINRFKVELKSSSDEVKRLTRLCQTYESEVENLKSQMRRDKELFKQRIDRILEELNGVRSMEEYMVNYSNRLVEQCEKINPLLNRIISAKEKLIAPSNPDMPDSAPLASSKNQSLTASSNAPAKVKKTAKGKKISTVIDAASCQPRRTTRKRAEVNYVDKPEERVLKIDKFKNVEPQSSVLSMSDWRKSVSAMPCQPVGGKNVYDFASDEETPEKTKATKKPRKSRKTTK